ncbi:unnamed protein product [Malus baccata var. baccata]
MDPTTVATKPHAVCIPLPAQSHIKAMLKFAKLLHHRGFHITFVNSKYNHRRFLKSLGSHSLDGLPDFRFAAIPDGLPDSDGDTTQDPTLLIDAIRKQNFLAPFHDLLNALNNDAITTSNNPPVTCIVSDGFMSTSTITAAEEIGVPIILFYTIAASSFMGLIQFRALIEKGTSTLESYLTNGYLDKVIDWIPGMKDIRLKDLPTFIRTTNPDDRMFNFMMESTDRVREASAVVLHTFDALERDVLDALSSMLPLFLWKEETECLQWLNTREPNSVVYVNFGSVIVMTSEQLVEFCWGFANSKLPFFWVIRPDLVNGESAILPPEFVVETKERSLIASWCPQEQVLNHPSVGGFLTHSGWNSTIESLTAGVPMLCWPFFFDQQMDCRYSCNEWGIGMEISNDVKRDEVEKLVRELMDGEKGKKMKKRVVEWKELAEEATSPHGSSSKNLDNLVNQVLLG